MMDRPTIGITMGDAAGAGPEIIMKALQDPHIHEQCRPIVIGDAKFFNPGGTFFCRPAFASVRSPR